MKESGHDLIGSPSSPSTASVAFDLGIPAQVFGAARRPTASRLYEVRIVHRRRRPGAHLGRLHDRPRPRTGDPRPRRHVVSPASRRPAACGTARLRRARRPRWPRVRPGARMVSICTGAFVLAAAGLLDGRPATTHWAYADRFRALYPQVKLDPDVLFVDDGDVLTSAGVAAGIDLCLHIVRRDHGSDVANRGRPALRGAAAGATAGRRSSSSARCRRPSDEPRPGRPGPGRWSGSTEPLDLAALARHARMSVRTFTRRFRDETGTEPGPVADPAAGRARPAAAGDHRPAGRRGGPARRLRHGGLAAPAPARRGRRGAPGLPPDVPPAVIVLRSGASRGPRSAFSRK